MEKLRVAVIGVGIQGENHVKTYASHPLVDLVAICDLNRSRLREIGDRYNVERRYTNYGEMLGREKLDLVSVATPDHLHLEPVLAAVRRGVSVLLEKPMATSYGDALRMVEEAKKHDSRIFVNFGNRFNPPFAVLKERVASGELGEVLYSYIRLSDTIYVPTKMLSWSSKTNVVFFLMSHTADLARWIVGSEVAKVKAYAGFGVLKDLGIEVPDYVVAILEFKNGSKTVLESSWILPESYPSIVEFKAEFVCSKGFALIDSTKQNIEVSGDSFSYPRWLGASEVNRRFFGFVRESISHIVDSLLKGEEPIVSEDDGVRNVEILEAINNSFRESREIVLEK